MKIFIYALTKDFIAIKNNINKLTKAFPNDLLIIYEIL